MEDHVSGENSTSYPDDQSLLNSPTIAAIQQRIIALESQSQAQQQAPQSDELTQAVRTGERWLIGINAAALIAQIIIAFIYLGQLRQMIDSNDLTRTALAGSNQSLSETLAEMQEQAKQMSRLADNAKTQADRTKDLADRSLTQIGINRTAANAAQDTAGTARDTLIQNQRPWVGMDISVNGPLVFNQESVTLPIHIKITNVGHSPAQYVKPWAKLVLGFDAPLQRELEDYCRWMGNPPVSNETNGWTLFPEQSKERDSAVSVGKKEIDKALAKRDIPGKVGAALIVCADYRPSFGEVKHYQTGQAYAVIWFDMSRGGGGVGAFEPKGQYSPISLYLQPGGFAN